jgi:hypothetical protein
VAVLEVRASNRTAPTQGQGWQFRYLVTNVGEGTAHGAVLTFAEGEVQLQHALARGEEQKAILEVPAEDYPKGSTPDHPPLHLTTFQDPDGTWWTQSMIAGHLRLPQILEGA